MIHKVDRVKNGMYKTELCRGWDELGWCKYGSRCQFAHGQQEIRPSPRHHHRFKTSICKTFWMSGCCAYGKRCCYLHLSPTSPFDYSSTIHTDEGCSRLPNRTSSRLLTAPALPPPSQDAVELESGLGPSLRAYLALPRPLPAAETFNPPMTERVKIPVHTFGPHPVPAHSRPGHCRRLISSTSSESLATSSSSTWSGSTSWSTISSGSSSTFTTTPGSQRKARVSL